MKLWCFVTGNVFLLQGLKKNKKKGLMSTSGNSSNLIPVVHCMLFFIVILLYSGLKQKKGAISYFTFETKMGSQIFWQTFNL